jgi:hypothetical protein
MTERSPPRHHNSSAMMDQFKKNFNLTNPKCIEFNPEKEVDYTGYEDTESLNSSNSNLDT